MTTSTNTIAKEAEEEVQQLADSDADSVDSNIRYMAYGSRLRTALVASSRYVAYVSELFCVRIASINTTASRLAMLARPSDLL